MQKCTVYVDRLSHHDMARYLITTKAKKIDSNTLSVQQSQLPTHTVLFGCVNNVQPHSEKHRLLSQRNKNDIHGNRTATSHV